MRKETQGKTDLFIGSWLKSQRRDKVLIFLMMTAPIFFLCGVGRGRFYVTRNCYIDISQKTKNKRGLNFNGVPSRIARWICGWDVFHEVKFSVELWSLDHVLFISFHDVRISYNESVSKFYVLFPDI